MTTREQDRAASILTILELWEQECDGNVNVRTCKECKRFASDLADYNIAVQPEERRLREVRKRLGLRT